MIAEILGNVPSKSNKYIPVAKGRMVKNSEVKAYEKAFILQLPPEWKKRNLDRPFSCEIAFYYRTSSSDLDGGWKIILDCLQRAGAIKNDNLMYYQVGRKYIDAKNPRIIIEIEEININEEP